jgi:hypothetical protein
MIDENAMTLKTGDNSETRWLVRTTIQCSRRRIVNPPATIPSQSMGQGFTTGRCKHLHPIINKANIWIVLLEQHNT